MQLEFRDVRQCPAEYDRVESLYRRAFPEEEQMPTWLFRRRIRRDDVRLYSVWAAEWVGFVYLLVGEKTAYLMYFAVDDSCRGQGYGSQILSELRALLPGRQILVSVEPLDPDAENCQQREKRQSFYRRNGYVDSGYQVKEGEVTFDLLLSEINGFAPADYLALMKGFIGRLLGFVFHPAIFPSGEKVK